MSLRDDEIKKLLGIVTRSESHTLIYLELPCAYYYWPVTPPHHIIFLYHTTSRLGVIIKSVWGV